MVLIPRRVWLLVLVLLAGALGLPLTTERESPQDLDFSGRVVRVTDGDTIEVLRGGRSAKVRLYGIDCPEHRQPFGSKARQFTSGLAFGREVAVEVEERDRYGRFVGTVTLPDGTLLNHALVRSGYACWYERFAANDRTLRDLERNARNGRLGLWSQNEPTPPWLWREATRTSWK